MKRREMKGIPRIVQGIRFGSVDDGPFAPLHRRIGIETKVHQQAILCHPYERWSGRTNMNAHWYRMPITLPKVG